MNRILNNDELKNVVGDDSLTYEYMENKLDAVVQFSGNRKEALADGFSTFKNMLVSKHANHELTDTEFNKLTDKLKKYQNTYKGF